MSINIDDISDYKFPPMLFKKYKKNSKLDFDDGIYVQKIPKGTRLISTLRRSKILTIQKYINSGNDTNINQLLITHNDILFYDENMNEYVFNDCSFNEQLLKISIANIYNIFHCGRDNEELESFAFSLKEDKCVGVLYFDGIITDGIITDGIITDGITTNNQITYNIFDCNYIKYATDNSTIIQKVVEYADRCRLLIELLDDNKICSNIINVKTFEVNNRKKIISLCEECANGKYKKIIIRKYEDIYSPHTIGISLEYNY